MTSEQPQWDHDCPNCQFLGNFVGNGQSYDLYVCRSVSFPEGSTLIARHASEAGAYASIFNSELERISYDFTHASALQEALRRSHQ